jgi:hypothetical protein
VDYLSQIDPVSKLATDYGYVGAITACLIVALVALWRREIKAHDEERRINAELRGEIKALNEKIQNQALTVLSETGKVVNEFLIVTRKDR